MKIGFDNEKYLQMQSEHIRERISKFDNKLYLEFGGKLFDDYHASRVLPGFEPDSKIRMLKALSEDAEIVIAINADAIEKNIEHLCYLARYGNLSLFAHNLSQLLQTLDNSERRLVEYHRTLLLRQCFDAFFASLLLRQKTLEAEAVTRKATLH